MQGLALELSRSLAEMVRTQGIANDLGFELVDVRVSQGQPAHILTLKKRQGNTVAMVSVTVSADVFTVRQPPQRGEVRTPGPIDGPNVMSALNYWHRPHKNTLGEQCHGEAGLDSECTEGDCAYSGERNE